ncbi:hypothetical protein DFH08DRAFT_1090443 [Mycena albidolilacea]|uniref:Uncharacterized protein n=1 Tax=Mycena albidolilacea TaxID=1033008 RepID=A0AAD6YX03_9AGAR|nr:hypothetical protein DFH08DRAFT_1090443 [Mycena albidolilacea]
MDPAVAPSSSSSRAPPFSLVEFRNLVSAALDSPDPIPFSESSPLFSVSYTPLESEQNGSRVRQIIQKFKKRATSLVRRPSTRTTAVVRANSPEYHIPELRLSANVSCDEFAPYLPLVTQYERRSPYVRPMSTCRSTPFLPSQYSLTNLYDLSNSSHTSFTPSPTRTSCSSGSTSSESQYPTTPLNTVFEANRRWSRCSTDETYENPSDPFAKPIVPVSCFHTYTPAITKPSSRPPRRRARLPLSPTKPPPVSPIPALPPLPHPYRRATPLMFPESPTPPSRSRSESVSRSLSRKDSSNSLLDAFPAPPTHTPTPPVTPTRPRRCRASSPFPFTPTRSPDAGADWLDLSSSPGSLVDGASSASGHSDVDVFHSACSGASCL